jgi:hypothetical protein
LVTVKLDELVTEPEPVETVIGPVLARFGTIAVIRVSELTVNDAALPLKVTVRAR